MTPRARFDRIVGSSVVGLLAAAVFALSIVGGFNPAIPKQRHWVKFRDVDQLGRGANVRLDGLNVGLVGSLALLPDGVLVEITVDSSVRLHGDYQVLVRSLSIFGGRFVELRPGDPRLAVVGSSPEQPLRGDNEASLVDTVGEMVRRVGEELEATFENLNEAVRRIDEEEGTLGKVLSDDFAADLERVAARLEVTTATMKNMGRKMDEGAGTLGRLLREPRVGDAVERLTGALEAMDRRAGEGTGAFVALTEDEELAEALELVQVRLSAVVDALTAEDGALGGGRMDKVRDDLARTSDHVATILERFREGEGPLPALVADERLDQDLARARDALERFGKRPAQSSIARLQSDHTLLADIERDFRYYGLAVTDAGETTPVSPTLEGFLKGRLDAAAGKDTGSGLGGF